MIIFEEKKTESKILEACGSLIERLMKKICDLINIHIERFAGGRQRRLVTVRLFNLIINIFIFSPIYFEK